MNQPRLIARVPLSTRLDTVPPGASWYAEVGDSYTPHVNGAGTDAEPAVGLSLRARRRGHALAAYRFLQRAQFSVYGLETAHDAMCLLALDALTTMRLKAPDSRSVLMALSPEEALSLFLLREAEGVEP